MSQTAGEASSNEHAKYKIRDINQPLGVWEN